MVGSISNSMKVSHKIILFFSILFILIFSGCAKITPSPGEAITEDERIELRAIVVPTSDQAEETYKELRGKPFWLLAQERSVHPSSREGGFLGLVRKKELGREYQKALEGLKEGDFSLVFKTGDGYYAIVQMTTTRYFKKALEHYFNGSLDEAVEGFLKDLALNPDNIYSYMTLGIIYDHKKDYEKAIEMHKAALQLDPSNETIYNNLATTYFNLDRPKAAIETYKKALEVAPDSANIKNNLAWVYASEGIRLDEGITMVKELIEKEPDKARYIETLSELYYRKGMYDDALREVRKGIEIEPNNENLRIQSRKIENAKNRKLQPLVKMEKEGLDVGIRLKDSVSTEAPLRKELMIAKAAEADEAEKTARPEKEGQKKETISEKDEKKAEAMSKKERGKTSAKKDKKKSLESKKKEKEKEIVAKAYSDEKEFGPGSGWEEIKPPVLNEKERNVEEEKGKTKPTEEEKQEEQKIVPEVIQEIKIASEPDKAEKTTVAEPERETVKPETEKKEAIAEPGRKAEKVPFYKKAERDIHIKILIPNKGSENETAAALKKMGYKVSMVGKAEKHASETTVYFKKGFKDVAERIAKGLKGRKVIKPLSWASAFDIIILIGQ